MGKGIGDPKIQIVEVDVFDIIPSYLNDTLNRHRQRLHLFSLGARTGQSIQASRLPTHVPPQVSVRVHR